MKYSKFDARIRNRRKMQKRVDDGIKTSTKTKFMAYMLMASLQDAAASPGVLHLNSPARIWLSRPKGP